LLNEEKKMLANVKKIINECCKVKKGEKVAIITDTKESPKIYMALFDEAKNSGAEPIVIIMKPISPGGELPFLVNEAIRNADLLITPTSTSVYHSKGIRDACLGNKARLLALSECDEETLVEGGINADFLNISYLAKRIGKYFDKGNVIKLLTPAGTDLVAKIDGRKGYLNTGLCHEPKQMQGLPTIEVFIAPIEESVNGTIVVDASCSGGIGIINEPIYLTVTNGRVVSIDGKKEAAMLKDLLGKANNENAYQVAEMAVGLNPNCRITGKIVEDEGKYGTCHVALGNNLGFGGKSNAPLHIDMVQWKPTLLIDDIKIFEEGEKMV